MRCVSDAKPVPKSSRATFRARSPQRGDLVRHALIALSEIDRLGDLQDRMVQRDTLSGERGFHAVGEIAAAEIRSREIDADMLHGNPASQPAADITSDAADHLSRECRSHLRILGCCMEIDGRNDLTIDGSHPCECLDADNLAGIDTNDRLVPGLDPIVLQGLGDTLGCFQAFRMQPTSRLLFWSSSVAVFPAPDM